MIIIIIIIIILNVFKCVPSTQCDLSHSFVYSKSLKEFDLEIALKWLALTLNAI